MALTHINFFSDALVRCVSCDVILPQLRGGRPGDEKFKTLYLLHGSSDDETIWQRRTSIERYVSAYGLAVVMPAVSLSSYADMAHGARYYTYISSELPRLMRTFFPLSEKREDNFIAGLSMGGAGALKIGLANPDKYAAICCLSAGAYGMYMGENDDPRFREKKCMLYDGRKLADTEEDVFGNASRACEAGRLLPRIYHSCGSEDFLLENAHKTRDFFQAFPDNPFDYKYEEDPGSHTWEYWDEHIRRFLDYLKLEPDRRFML